MSNNTKLYHFCIPQAVLILARGGLTLIIRLISVQLKLDLPTGTELGNITIVICDTITMVKGDIMTMVIVITNALW